MGIDPKLIDQLPANYTTPADIVGENRLVKQLTRAVLERALQAELTGHLGNEKCDPAGHNSGNSRNGSNPKTLNGNFGKLELETLRDRNGASIEMYSFETTKSELLRRLRFSRIFARF